MGSPIEKKESYIDLYHEVINTLKYSLTDFDKESDDFYNEKSEELIAFVTKAFINRDYFKDTFPFICTSFCHIKDHRDWDTLPTKDYLFYHHKWSTHTHKDDLASLVYIYAAIGDHGKIGQRTSSLLSKTIKKPCVIRVQVQGYLWLVESDNDILTITCPENIFPVEWKIENLNNLVINSEELKSDINSSYRGNWTVGRNEKAADYFLSVRKEKFEKYEEAFKDLEKVLFEDVKGRKISGEFFDELVFTENAEDNLKTAIALSILGVAYCSFALDTTVEYICRTPFSLILNGKSKDRGLGSLILGYPKGNFHGQNGIKELDEKRKKAIILYDLINGYLANCYTQQLLSEIKRAQVKSSIAAIMGRNGSHNLGSHVISNLTHHYSNPTDMQYLYKYLQHRMDFTAAITSDWPKWTSSMALCKFIMRYVFQQRLLLNHIIRAEGITAYEPNHGDEGFNLHNQTDETDKLIIKIGKISQDEEGLNHERKITWIIDPRIDRPSHDLLSSQDVNLSIPGGIVGLHALMSIFENSIRNIAKHDWSLKERYRLKNLEYYILFEEKKTEVEISISSNACRVETEQDMEKFLESMNQRLWNPIVDSSTNSHRTSDLGLAEIKICAEFLNRNEAGYVDNEVSLLKSKVKFKEISTVDEIRNLWAYNFSIPKPKLALLISQGYDIPAPFECSQLEFRIGDPENKDYNYDFVVYLGKEQTTELLPPLSFQPLRIMKLSESDSDIIIKLLQTRKDIIKREEEIHSFLYKIYLQKLFRDDNLSVNFGITLRDPDYSGQDKILNQFDDFYKHESNRITRCLTSDDSDKLNEGFESQMSKENESSLKIPRLENEPQLRTYFEGLYNKYEEHIETLPEIFTDGKKNGNKGALSNGKETINVNLTLGAFNQEKVKTISFKRHSNDWAPDDLYTESISGSQSYFYELEKLYHNLAYYKKGNPENSTANSLDLDHLEYSSRIFLFELLENSIFRYHIFDERMYGFIKTLKTESNENLNKFLNVGVSVCQNIKVNEIKQGVQRCYCNDFKKIYCAHYRPEDSASIHPIAIIHIGLLDKLKKTDPDVELPELLGSLLGSHEFIILTSGRAPSINFLKKEYLGDREKHSKLWQKVRFLAISELHNSLKKQFPEKLLFTNLVMKSQFNLE